MHINLKMKTATSWLNSGVDFGTSSYKRVKSTQQRASSWHQQRLSSGSRVKTVPSKVSPILNPSWKTSQRTAVTSSAHAQRHWSLWGYTSTGSRIHVHIACDGMSLNHRGWKGMKYGTKRILGDCCRPVRLDMLCVQHHNLSRNNEACS